MTQSQAERPGNCWACTGWVYRLRARFLRDPAVSVLAPSYLLPVLEQFAPDAPKPQMTDPLVQMARRLGKQAGRAVYGLRKQTVEPVFGIIRRVMGRQMSMRGLDKARG